jgi:6-phosphogluconate dehydrogenase
MQLGMIGLGRMGGNIVRRLMRGGHDCVVYDKSAEAVATLAAEGAGGTKSMAELVAGLTKPRAIWIMLPAGEVTGAAVEELADLLAAGDIVIDGGNSFYQDDIKRAARLKPKGISYVDVGTSGGVWGLERGYCMMIGGERQPVAHLDPIFDTLAPGIGTIERTPHRAEKGGSAERGYIHCGPSGAGHFVKMVHNGIEYGLMQAYAEGFDILHSVATAADVPAERRYQLDLADIAEVWRRGSVVSSWLLDLSAIALTKNADLADYSGVVADSGEGRWTIKAAIEQAVPADVLSAALYARFRSRQEHTFAERLLSAMRFQFGGHVEKKTGG